MVWAKTPMGKNIPLDVRKTSQVYELIEGGPGKPDQAEKAAGYHVTHFATCPKSNAFSGGGKRKLPKLGSFNDFLLSVRRAEARAADNWEALEGALKRDDLVAFVRVLFETGP